MSEFLFHYYPVHPTTWVYLSSLLMIGLFFKFGRFWSVRNLDLALLILLAPGLLLVHGGEAREEEEVAQLEAAQQQEAYADIEELDGVPEDGVVDDVVEPAEEAEQAAPVVEPPPVAPPPVTPALSEDATASPEDSTERLEEDVVAVIPAAMGTAQRGQRGSAVDHFNTLATSGCSEYVA